MLKLLFSILLLITGLQVFAETNDTLHWNGVKSLTKADFKGEPMEFTGFIGESFCMNLANFERADSDSKINFVVYAVFDRNKSWLSSKGNTKDGILFFQVMFNLYELHARKLRKELSLILSESDVKEIFQRKYNESMSALINQLNELKKETKLGADHKALLKYEEKVQLQLSELEEFRNYK